MSQSTQRRSLQLPIGSGDLPIKNTFVKDSVDQVDIQVITSGSSWIPRTFKHVPKYVYVVCGWPLYNFIQCLPVFGNTKFLDIFGRAR